MPPARGAAFGAAHRMADRVHRGAAIVRLTAHPALAQAGINASPEQAAQLSTDQVQQIATQAQQANPGVVAQLSSFYAQHPVLVKSLGAAALAIVLGRMRSPGR